MKNTTTLKKNHEFQTVYKRGKSIANRELVIYVLQNKNNSNKIGISVSKKVGNSVIRSRITRLIRESYRLSEDNIKLGYDIIVIARVGAKDKNYHIINHSLNHLLKKQNLILKK